MLASQWDGTIATSGAARARPASARSVARRRSGIPNAPSGAAAIASSVGKTCVIVPCGCARRSPAAATRRAAWVRAAATDTCWPSTARTAISLAYYSGYSYREVAELLDTALPTIKTRMRDGLIRLRDCLGVTVP